jgi:hypothetical protein
MYLPRKTRMAISVLLALSGLLPSVIQAQQVPDALSCRTCAISVQEVARFGSAAEPAPHTPRDVLYHAGHYWILTDEQVLVFDARGARLGTIGRRGQGPGEFRDPVLLLPAAGDSVAVIDQGAGRVAVISKDRKPGRTISFVTPATSVRLVSWPDRVLVSAMPGVDGDKMTN